jgi:hypothetical protein
VLSEKANALDVNSWHADEGLALNFAMHETNVTAAEARSLLNLMKEGPAKNLFGNQPVGMYLSDPRHHRVAMRFS